MAEAREELDQETLTRLIEGWCEGDARARDALMSLVYAQLRTMARRQFGRGQASATLQPTALVNEAFLKLDQSAWQVESKRHFFALAARVMRQVLVDHAKAGAREKRGGDQLRVTLSDDSASSKPPDSDIIELDAALSELNQSNARAARALELAYFGGLEQSDIAEELEVSLRTVERELRFGRAWLKAQLASG